MANRPVFIASEDINRPYYSEETVSFTYYSGFAVTQKQKSIRSLHENAIAAHNDWKILEVSSKSEEPIGVRLSAFNLQFIDEETGNKYPLENVFQSSKTYEYGGPYYEMLKYSPKDAKRDTRHHTSGKLKCFTWRDWKCPLEPKTMFYDWIYCKSLYQNRVITESLIAEGYNAFTDIEFNPEKSINCQARAVAIYVSLYRRGQLSEFLKDISKWETIYNIPVKKDRPEQLKLDFGI